MRRFEVMTIAIVSSIMTSILITGAIAVANYKAVPDTVPRLIPYRGNLDLNGEPYNGSLDMTFGLYHAATAGEAVWTETQNVTVYGGKFSALLGNSNAQSVADLTDVVTGGDDLYLEVSLNGEVLQGRQRFFPAPFALWTTASTDFNVDHDLTVGQNATVQNDLSVSHNAAVQNDLTVNRHAKVNGTLTLGGTDLMFGPHATRGDGGRALVHHDNDSLVLNYANDFPGGTKVVGGENDGTNAALKVESGSQRLLVDGNEIDATNTDGSAASLYLNNNSQQSVVINGPVDAKSSVATTGNLSVGGEFSFDKEDCRAGTCGMSYTTVQGGRDCGSCNWKDWRYCPTGTYICGLRIKIDECSDCDNWGVTDQMFACCPF